MLPRRVARTASPSPPRRVRVCCSSVCCSSAPQSGIVSRWLAPLAPCLSAEPEVAQTRNIVLLPYPNVKLKYDKPITSNNLPSATLAASSALPASARPLLAITITCCGTPLDATDLLSGVPDLTKSKPPILHLTHSQNNPTEGLEYLVQVRQELKAEKNAMALSFVTIHLALNMTTRLVGQPPQPTTPTPWPLRHHLSSQRWRPHGHPVPPFLLLYNIIRGKTGYTLTL